MPLTDIQLDDRRFEELVQEAKRRIPGYTPEWTDFNDSDPGITLVHLFAWLTEMILYRLNKVPEKNFIKFLELVGIELRPAVPAQAELTFKLSDPGAAVLIPARTRVSLAEQGGDGAPVIFETDDNLYAVGAELKGLQSFDGAQYRLLTETNRVEGKFYYAFGRSPRKHAALYLGFDRPLPPRQIHRLTFHVYTADLIAQGQGVAAGAVEPAPPVIAYWEYWAGTQQKWLPLNPAKLRDHTGSLTRSGAVEFEAPDVWPTEKLGLLKRDQDLPLHWLRYRIEEVLGGGYETPPRLENVLLNTIGGSNAVSQRDELLGASDGLPNQEFQLANVPVLPGTLVLEVDEGDGFKAWTAVRDFAASKRENTHYVVELTTGKIRFGNGKQGKIPAVLFLRTTGAFNPAVAGEEQANIRAREYRSGGGARGNAGGNTITGLQASIPFVASVTNLRPSEGGQDEETVAEAKARAPRTIQSGSRAVTAEDFEFLAQQTPGARIRRAKAFARHPEYEPTRPGGAGLPAVIMPTPGVVTVMVVPEAERTNPRPMPADETLKRVATWLQKHALITTELYVVAPKYRKVAIEARVTAAPSARSDQVAEALVQKLLDYFHPLRGGPSNTGWDFGAPILFSDVYRQVLGTSGVDRLQAGDLTIFVDDKPMAGCTDIRLEPDELVYSEKHTIFVSYA